MLSWFFKILKKIQKRNKIHSDKSIDLKWKKVRLPDYLLEYFYQFVDDFLELLL